jgi:hypothetical protein
VLTAQVAAVTAQSQGAKVSVQDLLIYGRREAGFPPAAAAVAIALKAEGKLPPEIIAVWDRILEAAERGVPVPQQRWLVGDGIWLLAPVHDGRSWSGLLVLSPVRPGQVVRLHDPDRPLCPPVWVRLPRWKPAALAIGEARLAVVPHPADGPAHPPQ